MDKHINFMKILSYIMYSISFAIMILPGINIVVKGVAKMENIQLIIVLGGFAVSVLGLIIAIETTTKSNNKESLIRKSELSKEHNDLSKEHDNLSEKIGNKIADGNKEINNNLKEIDLIVREEKIRRECLSSSKLDISNSMEAFINDWKITNAENAKLKADIEMLKEQNSILANKINELTVALPQNDTENDPPQNEPEV